MLVQVERIIPGDPVLARVATPCGRTTVRWCGDPDAAPGAFHVEWTVDEDLLWGGNARAASVAAPEVRADGDRVVLRGVLDVTEDGAGVLTLAGTLVLLDVAAPLPDGVDGTWVEVAVERRNAALFPYRL
ncbi:hypothetical protein [Yinghuangia seranimata]|uniref:hypothetical protein n=1 Tax=Yinghuangia seranimata TaxID=408067 RepID=UPI00248AC438|nr:hypothetical protein [Yinghuangia seranimata]MDI2127533.1 hypothetical protein [Yinghuangia seranimata]